MGGHRKYEFLIAMLKILLKFYHTKAPKLLTLLSFGVVAFQKPVRNKDLIDRNGKSLTIKALAHYNDFHKDFSEKIVVNIVFHI